MWRDLAPYVGALALCIAFAAAPLAMIWRRLQRRPRPYDRDPFLHHRKGRNR